MTMTDTNETSKPVRKKAKRRRPALTLVPKKAPPEFAGLSEYKCCDDCRVDRCVITGIGICGSPMKGGLQAPLMVKPEVVARYERAKKFLAHTKIDKLPG